MATLPRDLESATVSTMWAEEVRYAHPSAMLADLDRVLWLRGSADTVVIRNDFFCMRVELREDGYHVWPAPGHTYELEDPVCPDDLVPVRELYSHQHVMDQYEDEDE